jgi:hypothetical protein
MKLSKKLNRKRKDIKTWKFGVGDYLLDFGFLRLSFPFVL